MPDIGDTKIESKLLLVWTGTAWEVVGLAPPVPRGSPPFARRPEDTETVDDEDE